jgi:hypothetical protein
MPGSATGGKTGLCAPLPSAAEWGFPFAFRREEWAYQAHGTRRDVAA